MTLFDARVQAVEPSADVVWSAPDTDLWVGTIGSEYAGMIEFIDGHFVVRDHAAAIVATCSSIPAAQQALATHAAAVPSAAHDALGHAIAALAPKPRSLRPGYLRGLATSA